MNHTKMWHDICVFSGILLILLGIIAIFFPAFLIMFLSIFVGFSLLFFGIAQFYQGIVQMDVVFIGVTKLLFGLLYAVIGILFFFDSNIFYGVFAITFGLWAMVYGFINFKIAAKRKNEEQSIWLNLIKGTVNMLAGVVIILFPITSATILVIVMGLYLIFLGATLLFDVYNKKNIV